MDLSNSPPVRDPHKVGLAGRAREALSKPGHTTKVWPGVICGSASELSSMDFEETWAIGACQLMIVKRQEGESYEA
jgi:hypothetical protein